jgi:hypothetical protein
MLRGRRIWALNNYVKKAPFFIGPLHVLSVKKVLPAGPVKLGDGKVIHRSRTLVMLRTDPGGDRVLAAADIWGRDPTKSDSPWK